MIISRLDFLWITDLGLTSAADQQNGSGGKVNLLAIRHAKHLAMQKPVGAWRQTDDLGILLRASKTHDVADLEFVGHASTLVSYAGGSWSPVVPTSRLYRSTPRSRQVDRGSWDGRYGDACG